MSYENHGDDTCLWLNCGQAAIGRITAIYSTTKTISPVCELHFRLEAELLASGSDFGEVPQSLVWYEFYGPWAAVVSRS